MKKSMTSHWTDSPRRPVTTQINPLSRHDKQNSEHPRQRDRRHTCQRQNGKRWHTAIISRHCASTPLTLQGQCGSIRVCHCSRTPCKSCCRLILPSSPCLFARHDPMVCSAQRLTSLFHSWRQDIIGSVNLSCPQIPVVRKFLAIFSRFPLRLYKSSACPLENANEAS